MIFIMTFFGFITFIISLFTVGFKSAFKRLLMFIGTGALIDILIGILIACVYYN